MPYIRLIHRLKFLYWLLFCWIRKLSPPLDFSIICAAVAEILPIWRKTPINQSFDRRILSKQFSVVKYQLWINFFRNMVNEILVCVNIQLIDTQIEYDQRSMTTSKCSTNWYLNKIWYDVHVCVNVQQIAIQIEYVICVNVRHIGMWIFLILCIDFIRYIPFWISQMILVITLHTCIRCF